jgi:hypothetical protein
MQVGYNGSTAESAPSYPAMVLLERKEEAEEELLLATGIGALGRRKSQRLSVKEIEVGGGLRWGEDELLPSLATKVLSSELHNTYFQVLLWK